MLRRVKLAKYNFGLLHTAFFEIQNFFLKTFSEMHCMHITVSSFATHLHPSLLIYIFLRHGQHSLLRHTATKKLLHSKTALFRPPHTLITFRYRFYASQKMIRSYPNIVITGTPGTGKSTHSSLLASTYSPSSSSSHPLRQIDVGVVVKKENFYTDYLEEWQSYEVNEDQLLDHLEPLTGTKAMGEDDEERGGLVLDWHTCDVWPERWVDLVVVLRCDHGVLWERLEKR